MGYQHRLVIAVFMAGTFVSCKKDGEKEPPSVTIVSPVAGSDLSVPDTLDVLVDVSGTGTIDQVAFTILNASGIPVTEPVVVVPAGNPVRLAAGIPVLSESILSGDYTLSVRASAGDASGADQVGIDVTAAPLRLRRMLVIGQPAPGQVSVHVIDSTGAVTLANTLIMDLAGAAVNSAAQTVALAGSVDGPLTVFKPDGISVHWQKPNLGNSGIPWFTSLDLCEDGRYHVGTSDGRVRGYNALSGAVERVYDLLPGHRAQTTIVVGSLVITAQLDASGSAWRIIVHQAQSGAQISDQSVDQSVLAMYRRNDGQVLLFGDRNGHGVVKDHNIQAGGGWEPYSWSAAITSVERLDANTFLVALSDGSIDRFSYSSATSTTVASLFDAHDMALDPVSGAVLVGAGQEVITIDPLSGAIGATFTIGAPVRHVLPLLNR